MPSKQRIKKSEERRRRPVRRVGILGTGSELPERILSNADLEEMVGTSDEWIRTRTGMRERRIVADGQAASHLALGAARAALARSGLEPENVELIIVATFTPDTICPPTVCYVQDRLGATRAAGFDLSIACSGFVNALATAQSMIASGAYDNALVIGVEVLSSVTDYQSRESCVLFGDGAGAAVLGAESEGGEILDTIVRIDGSGAALIEVPAGGSAKPASVETVARREHFLRLSGPRVFKFAVGALCDTVNEILMRNGYALDELDCIVPHQGNLRIIETAAEKLGVSMERVVVNIESVGNTSSASIPLAFDAAVRDGRIQRGDLVCLVAFGAGLSWGATLLRW